MIGILKKNVAFGSASFRATNFPTQLLEHNKHVLLTSTALYVRDLAKKEGIQYSPLTVDSWANAVTQLTGDEAKSDATGNLLVALTRSRKITPEQMVYLVIQHHRELKSF